MDALKKKLQAGRNQVTKGPEQYNKVRFLSKCRPFRDSSLVIRQLDGAAV